MGGIVEHPQLEPGFQHPPQRAVEVGFFDQPLFIRGEQMLVYAAAVEVAAFFDTQRGGFRHRVGDMIVAVQVIDSAAIRHHMTLESPAVAQNISQQHIAGVARFPVDGVVRAHHRLHLCLFDAIFKRGQIGVEHIAFADHRVEMVALRFGTAVHSEVLGAGGGFHMVGIVALQPFDKCHAHAAGQIRVLAVGFVTASPAGIAKDVDIGTPKGQPFIDAAIPLTLEFVVFGTAFGRNGRRYIAQKGGVEGGRQADRLREHRGDTGTRHAVQRLVPIAVRADAQPRNGRGVVSELEHLFLHRQAADQVVYPLFQRQAFVAECKFAHNNASLYLQ